MRHPERAFWRLPSLFGDYLIARAGKEPPGGANPVPSSFVISLLDAWLSSPISAGTLYDICKARGGVRPSSLGGQRARRDHKALKERLREALERGELVVFEVPARVPRAMIEPEPEKPPPAPAEEVAETTFIAIQLVDPEKQPIPNAKYRLTLPDGSVREGALSANGYVRIDGIPPGKCQVTFPDLGASA